MNLEELKVTEIPKNYRHSQEKWDKIHPEIVKESKAKYDAKRPVISFRPTREIFSWLEEEQWDSESKAESLNRKLEKLMKLEQQGY